MDSDRDCGHIEKLIRQKSNIYSIDEYQDIMARSQRKLAPKVTRMAGKLYNMKELPLQLNLINRGHNTAGKAVKFRDKVRWIQVTHFGQYRYKHSFSDSEDWKTVDILRESADQVHDGDVRQKLKHCQSCIKKPKLADIKKQLPYVPQVHRDFYLGLESVMASNDDDQECGNDCNDEVPSEDFATNTISSAEPSRRTSARCKSRSKAVGTTRKCQRAVK